MRNTNTNEFKTTYALNTLFRQTSMFMNFMDSCIFQKLKAYHMYGKV